MASASSDCGPPPLLPYLFVYDFPASYRVRGRHAVAVDNITFTFPAWPHPNHPLSSDWMYDVANIYYQRALNYRCRTDDPLLAAIFFVPVFNTEMTPHPSSFCAEKPRGAAEHHVVFYERLRAQTGDAFTRRGGADHFFVNPRPGAGYFESHPVCELNLLDARLGASQLLSIEQRPSREARDKTFTYFADPKFVSVPYPSWVRLPTVRSAMSEQHAPWRSHHHRPLRVAAVFGLTVGSPTASELRKRLLTYCVEWNAKSESSCKSVGPRGLLPSGRPIPPEQHPLGSFNSIAAATYWNATFCLMPGGDSVTRKATMDALLLGCIPVLFHKGQVSQWYWHWGDWVKNGTYFIDVNDVLMNRTDPIEELVSLSQARVKSMRQSLAANAHRMHYALKEGGGPRGKEDASSSSSGGGGEVEAEDAFEITLRAVRNRTAARVTAGLKIQQAAIEKAAAQHRLFASLNTTSNAVEGQCRGSTGAHDPTSCADNASAPWHPPRPLIRGADTLEQCIDLCRSCAKCKQVSYSLMLGLCTWHYRCNISFPGHIEMRWEMWAYRTWNIGATSHHPLVD